MHLNRLAIQILTALAVGESHAYGIYKQVLADSGWGLVVGDRAIYRELPRLLNRSLIEVVDSSGKPLRYRLTPVGRRRLRSEQDDLQQLLRVMRERG